MLDLKFVRENKETVEKELKNRDIKFDLKKFLEMEKELRTQNAEVEKLKSEQNKANLKIAQEKDSKKKQALISEMKKVADQIKKLKPDSKSEKEFKSLWLQLPNISDKDTPVGKDEKGNVSDHEWGNKPKFDFEPKPHYEVKAVKGMFDIKKGSEVSGARFWYLKGEIAKLQFALINYTIDFFTKEGFELILPPALVRRGAMVGSGFFPADENEIYKINSDKDDLFLSGTAEVPLVAYHQNEILDLKKPKKYLGYSTCFRREAGAYGKDLKGILRGHQFDKLELFIFADQKDSWKIYKDLLETSEKFWQSLKIPYQVMSMCTGDIALPNAKKFDIEGWISSEKRYRELGSCSHDTDFQARRLKIRYRDQSRKTQLAHTINHTACAIGRTIIAIVENNQTKEGNVKIPEVLQKYLDFKEIKV
ncbi:serine--tRNA ligase [Patescibacteria group bacterium]